MITNFAEEENICAHLGDEYENFHGAVIPPIYENSLFVFRKYEDIITAFKNEHKNYLYTRGKNPTIEILEYIVEGLTQGAVKE